MTISRDTAMGEEPVSYGIATGNRFAMVDIGDDIEDPAEFYTLIEKENLNKKEEKKKKKEKKPEKKKEEEKKPEPKKEEEKENSRGRGRGRGGRGRGRGDGTFNRDRPQRFNRDDDSRPPRLQDDGGDAKEGDDGERRRGGGYRGSRGGYRGTGGGRGGRGNSRGRQFDRHSGSDRSGVKPQEKREGGGSHNWGSPTEEGADASPSWQAEAAPAGDGWGNVQEAEPAAPSGFDNVQPSGFDDVQPSGFDNVEGAGDNPEEGAAGEAEDEGPELMTLEEFRAKEAEKKKVAQFKIRKAGENEDTAQWKNFTPLKKGDETAYMGGMDEYEKIIVRGGRKKNLVDVDVKFSKPSRRGGEGGGRGRGGGRGGGMGGGSDDGCRKCGQSGHWARECPNGNSGGGGGAIGGDDGCRKCGQSGHWARECPNGNQPPTEFAERRERREPREPAPKPAAAPKPRAPAASIDLENTAMFPSLS